MAEETNLASGYLGSLLTSARWFRDKLGGWFVLVTPLGALLLFLNETLTWVAVRIQDINQLLISSFNLLDFTLPMVQTTWQLCDYLLPVSFIFDVIRLIFGAYVLAIAIRVLKSFIPTIS